jgi:uncharacterized RmlC-like cupin family protein
MGVVDARCHESVHDVAGLRAVIDELRAAHGLLSQFAQLSAEMPGVAMERAAGIGDAAVLVDRRMQSAQARLRRLTAARTAPGVVVLDPDRGSWVTTDYGQPVLPVVTAHRINGVVGVCTGVTRLAAGSDSGARVHPDVDVVMVMVFGAAVIGWWAANKEFHRAICRRRQHAHIPRGTPYFDSNPGSVPMLAVVAQPGAELTAGVELLPELDSEVAEHFQRAADKGVHYIDV